MDRFLLLNPDNTTPSSRCSTVPCTAMLLQAVYSAVALALAAVGIYSMLRY